ncbi:DUF3349 domain-containing protein [Luteimicrobium sp. NPDC057192]|uniref:DUF3349 domain-containing protein n=1 Tax=Luteimicrobium sp. NPDC057192 TaxID=3346042 RepID=UPI00362CCEB3
MPSRVANVVGWLREGYPAGVPEHDYVPLFALLRRTLTEQEVEDVALAVVQQHDRGPIAHEAIEDLVSRTTAQEPIERDVARVRAVLAAAGWPLADPPADD